MQDAFDEIRAAAEAAYKTIEKVRCAYLNVEVLFNANGLEHIKFKRRSHTRPQRDQLMRLRLLSLVPIVLKKSRTLQGIRLRNKMERVKIRSRWEERMVHVAYYEFISIEKDQNFNNCRVRVIVKKIEGGQPFFWSIIPYWKQRRGSREMFEGNPEED